MKNAIVYKAHLPVADALEIHLAERPWRALAFGERIRHAFVEGEDGRRVHRFPGGYAIQLKTDEKILPVSVVKAEVAKRVAHLEDQIGERMSKDGKAAIKEEVTAELLERALTKEAFTWAYYDESEQLLFVDTASKTVADALIGELVQATASVKTETINIADIKLGLTARLTETIREEISQFGAFYLGANLKLTRKVTDQPLERVAYTESDIGSEEVRAQLDQGFSVDQIELGMRGTYFRLTKDFHFRRFEWPELEPVEDMTPAERWEHDTSVKVTLARGIILELCEMMQYQPPNLDEEAA